VYYLVAATPAGSQRRVTRRKLCKWNATPCKARPMDEVRRAAITCIHAFRAGNDLPLQSAPGCLFLCIQRRSPRLSQNG
jgi:hypothetical protein